MNTIQRLGPRQAETHHLTPVPTSEQLWALTSFQRTIIGSWHPDADPREEPPGELFWGGTHYTGLIAAHTWRDVNRGGRNGKAFRLDSGDGTLSAPLRELESQDRAAIVQAAILLRSDPSAAHHTDRIRSFEDWILPDAPDGVHALRATTIHSGQAQGLCYYTSGGRPPFQIVQQFAPEANISIPLRDFVPEGQRAIRVYRNTNSPDFPGYAGRMIHHPHLRQFLLGLITTHTTGVTA